MSNIAIAIQISDACKSAVNDEETRMAAMNMFLELGAEPNEQTIRALFRFMAHLTSRTATNVISVCLTESEISAMIGELRDIGEIDE
jgi:hypothetical protein